MNHNNTVLITGANGFLGNPLCRAVLTQGFDVQAAVGRLLESLRVDSAAMQHELDRHPPYSVEESLRATAEAYNRSLEDE